MIIEGQHVKLKANNYKQRYIDMGYIEDPEGWFYVEVSDLSDSSKKLEKRICDECGEPYTMSHASAIRSRKNWGKDICQKCSKTDKYRKIAQKKQEETCMKKFGVKNAGQSPEVRQKMHDTLKERYGVDYPAQSPIIQERIVQTNLEKRGVERPAQSQEVLNKMKNTMEDRYGVSWAMQSEEIRQKSIATCLENYGVEHISQSDYCKERFKNTMLERYGVEHALQVPEFMRKRNDTMVDRYGVEHSMQSPELRSKAISTFCKNGTIKTSSQQLYIYETLLEIFPECEIILNYNLDNYYILDIALFYNDIKIDIEYDGWFWHHSPQDIKHDNQRDGYVKHNYWRILRIKGGNKTPTVEELKEAICQLLYSDSKYTEIILDWKGDVDNANYN